MSTNLNTGWQKFQVILALLLVMFLVWKILVTGIGNIYEKQILDDKKAVDIALAWSDQYPSVLFKASQDEGAPLSFKERETLLKEALSGNPSDGRVLIVLANEWLKQGWHEKADKAADLAVKSLPSDPYTQIEAASYWLKRNNLDKAISNWSIVLETSPELKNKLFPLFLSWIEEEKLGASLMRVVLDPPQWWEGFFSYATLNASSMSTISRIYELKSNSRLGVTPVESNMYVHRLKKDGRWAEAFLAWLNSLGEQGMKYLGQPYNGNFEADISNTGFGWNYEDFKGVTVETEHTYGNMGGKALHLIFQGRNLPYQHIYQTMYLAPARYLLKGRVRPDSIVTSGGLKWSVRCMTRDKNQIGESERFLGVGQWRSFHLEFEVPGQNCEAQELRLESVVKKREDAIITGEIWFDSLLIERQ